MGRWMRRHGIGPSWRDHGGSMPASRRGFRIAANLVEPNFTAAAPNWIWLADITYVKTDQARVYLVGHRPPQPRDRRLSDGGRFARRTISDRSDRDTAAWRRPGRTSRAAAFSTPRRSITR